MKSFYTLFLVLIGLLYLCGCDNFDKFAKPLIQDDVELQSLDDNFTTPFNMSNNLKASFSRGEKTFLKIFAPEEGLGPIFNNTGCVSCHPSNGRGTPDLILIRFSIGDNLMLDQGGPQFQDKAIPEVPYEMLPIGVDKSPRLPPPVFGMGLIENIPVETILANADANDVDGDGISGRPHWVTAPAYVQKLKLVVVQDSNLVGLVEKQLFRLFSSRLPKHSTKILVLQAVLFQLNTHQKETKFLIQRLITRK